MMASGRWDWRAKSRLETRQSGGEVGRRCQGRRLGGQGHHFKYQARATFLYSSDISF